MTGQEDRGVPARRGGALERGGCCALLGAGESLDERMTRLFASLFWGSGRLYSQRSSSKGGLLTAPRNASLWRKYGHRRNRLTLNDLHAVIKLIVVDEEYDSSYNGNARYNERDAAKMMGDLPLPDRPLALRPSIANVPCGEDGKIELVEIRHRVFQTKLPAIHIYDLRAIPPGKRCHASMVEMLRRPSKGKKSILLLNRHGFSDDNS